MDRRNLELKMHVEKDTFIAKCPFVKCTSLRKIRKLFEINEIYVDSHLTELFYLKNDQKQILLMFTDSFQLGRHVTQSV